MSEQDVYLRPFDGERAQKVLDAMNVMVRLTPPGTPFTPCKACGEGSKLHYGSPDGESHCATCELELQGVIPVRPERRTQSSAEAHGSAVEPELKE